MKQDCVIENGYCQGCGASELRARQECLKNPFTENEGKKTVFHIWVGHKLGYCFSSAKKPPIKKGVRLKYMGSTTDMGWPKKMSTGRVLYKDKHARYLKKRSKATVN